MRYYIAILLLFCGYSSSFCIEETKANGNVKKIEGKFINVSKKQRNSLKKELFSDQIDILHHCYQQQPFIVAQFIKFFQGSTLSLVQMRFNVFANIKFYLSICQYHYIKHGFW